MRTVHRPILGRKVIANGLVKQWREGRVERTGGGVLSFGSGSLGVRKIAAVARCSPAPRGAPGNGPAWSPGSSRGRARKGDESGAPEEAGAAIHRPGEVAGGFRGSIPLGSGPDTVAAYRLDVVWEVGRVGPFLSVGRGGLWGLGNRQSNAPGSCE